MVRPPPRFISVALSSPPEGVLHAMTSLSRGTTDAFYGIPLEFRSPHREVAADAFSF